MNTLLSFMDKLYSDSKTLSIVYVVGAVLLFIFIVMLIISLRKPKDEPQIIEEPKIDEESKENIIESNNKEIIEDKKEEIIEKTIENEISEEPLTEQSIFEKTVIIPLDELQKEEKTLENILEKVETPIQEEIVEEKEIQEDKISSEIPNVDDFVDNIVKKTYEKNEQFSSVYVGDKTSTIKLDKVLEDLDVDEAVVESIVPEEEKTIELETSVQEEVNVNEVTQEDKKVEETTTQNITKEEKENTNSLDNLKKALDEKKKEVELKQDDLKAKLESLKQNK